MKGLSFLESQKTYIDFKHYENIIGMEIPPMMKLFYQSFDFSKSFSIPEFYHPIYESKYYIGDLVFEQLKKWPITLDKIDTLDEITNNWEIKKNEKDWYTNHLLRIAQIDIGGGIYIGMQNELKDNVILDIWDSEERNIPISNNIFDFFNGLELILNEESLYGYKYSQLYKNWGEDFWRVRS